MGFKMCVPSQRHRVIEALEARALPPTESIATVVIVYRTQLAV